MNETQLENLCLDWFAENGWEVVHGVDIAPDSNNSLRKDYKQILIEADLLSFRKKYDRQTIKKTLTIPKWLNDEALNKKINFSAVLKEALIEELHIR